MLAKLKDYTVSNESKCNSNSFLTFKSSQHEVLCNLNLKIF